MATSSSRTNGSNTSPRWGRAAPTIPSSSSSSSTRSQTVWVSLTIRLTRTSGCSRWNAPSRRGSSTSPGPVDEPSTRRPLMRVPISPISRSSSASRPIMRLA